MFNIGRLLKDMIKQITLAHDETGAYAIIWSSHGKQERHQNLSQATILRISRAVDRLVMDNKFWILPVLTGELGWLAKRHD